MAGGEESRGTIPSPLAGDGQGEGEEQVRLGTENRKQMEYTYKHKRIIAALLKKAGKRKEADVVLSDDKYRFEISEAVREARSILGIGAVDDDALLDALRRYENRDCPIFKECLLSKCEGGVWCNIYNLGGSHSFVGNGFRNLGTHVTDIPRKRRREIMLEMIKKM